MPLPQLNTQGNDQTNTLLKIQQMNAMDEQAEDRKIDRVRQNALFGLQKRKLDAELAPDVIELRNKEINAKIAKDNYLAQDAAVKARTGMADYVASILKRVPFDPELKGYTEFINGIKKDPLLADHAKTLPDPEVWLKPDLQSETGRRIPKEDEEKFKAIYTNLTNTAADIAAGKKPATLTRVQVPTSGGKFVDQTVGLSLLPGETFDPVKYGLPEGTRVWYKEEKDDTKNPTVPTSYEKVGADGKVYQVTTRYNPNTGRDEELGRVELSKLTEAKTKPGSEKDVKPWKVMQNEAGETVYTASGGDSGVLEAFKIKDGKPVKVTDASADKLTPLEIPMDPLIKGMLERAGGGKAKEEKKPMTGKDAEINTIRMEAAKAIAAGRDPNKVKARFKEMTGQDY